MTTRKILLLLVIGFFSVPLLAQNNFSCIIRNAENEPIPNVTVQLKGGGKGSASDENGKITIRNIPDGPQVLVFSGIGFKAQSKTVRFPLSFADSVFSISLEADEREMEPLSFHLPVLIPG